MSAHEPTVQLLRELCQAGVEFIVVGGTAAVLQAAPIVTQDVDIVHRRTEDNADRLIEALLGLDAYHRFDLSNRRLRPQRGLLLGHGHINLATRLARPARRPLRARRR